MCVWHFNVIRTVCADSFHTPPINCEFSEISIPKIFDRKPEVQKDLFLKIIAEKRSLMLLSIDLETNLSKKLIIDTIL